MSDEKTGMPADKIAALSAMYFMHLKDLHGIARAGKSFGQKKVVADMIWKVLDKYTHGAKSVDPGKMKDLQSGAITAEQVKDMLDKALMSKDDIPEGLILVKGVTDSLMEEETLPDDDSTDDTE